jgi:hypothetical protein
MYPTPTCYQWQPGNDDMFLNVQKESFSMGAGGYAMARVGFNLSLIARRSSLECYSHVHVDQEPETDVKSVV